MKEVKGISNGEFSKGELLKYSIEKDMCGRIIESDKVLIARKLSEWSNNLAINLPTILACDDICKLEGRYNGDCLVVGAGPSLRKNIQYIKDFPGTVITTDRAYQDVIKHRSPDYIAVLEAYTKYVLDNNISAFLPVYISPPSLSKYHGQKYFFVPYMDAAKELSGSFSFMSRKSQLSTGGNVGTCAYMIAQIMGFKNIVLIGFNFCSDGDEVNKNYQGWDKYLYIFRLLAKEFARRGIKTYNCTEGGIIEGDGITCMSFLEYLQK